jgi:hypothetical protein
MLGHEEPGKIANNLINLTNYLFYVAPILLHIIYGECKTGNARDRQEFLA